MKNSDTCRPERSHGEGMALAHMVVPRVTSQSLADWFFPIVST